MLLILLFWFLIPSSPLPTQGDKVYIPKVIRYDRPRKADVYSANIDRKRNRDRYTVVIAAAQESQPQLEYTEEIR